MSTRRHSEPEPEPGPAPAPAPHPPPGPVPGLLEPKQARSLDTLHRLLQAAEDILSEEGLEAATVPAIAERAGVSVGVVYRRFPDKDALLRAVYERFFRRAEEFNRHNLETLSRLSLPIDVMAKALIGGMASGMRIRRGLLRALIRYARSHPDPDYRRTAEEMNRATMRTIAEILLSRPGEMRHPHPETAIPFGLMSVTAVLRELIIEEDPIPGLESPDDLDGELVRMFLGYLGIG